MQDLNPPKHYRGRQYKQNNIQEVSPDTNDGKFMINLF